MDRLNYLCVVDPTEVRGGDREISMPELALDVAGAITRPDAPKRPKASSAPAATRSDQAAHVGNGCWRVTGRALGIPLSRVLHPASGTSIGSYGVGRRHLSRAAASRVIPRRACGARSVRARLLTTAGSCWRRHLPIGGSDPSRSACGQRFRGSRRSRVLRGWPGLVVHGWLPAWAWKKRLWERFVRRRLAWRTRFDARVATVSVRLADGDSADALRAIRCAGLTYQHVRISAPDRHSVTIVVAQWAFGVRRDDDAFRDEVCEVFRAAGIPANVSGIEVKAEQ
jgi:hypothetical protein